MVKPYRKRIVYSWFPKGVLVKTRHLLSFSITTDSNGLNDVTW